jgi:hypothetical protein
MYRANPVNDLLQDLLFNMVRVNACCSLKAFNPFAQRIEDKNNAPSAQ